MQNYFLPLTLLRKIIMAQRNAPRHQPYKINFAVTKECHSRCVNCRIWEEQPANELTIAEIEQIALKNNYLSWINFTGGEPYDREDLAEVVRAFTRHCKNLGIVHLPTNGMRPARIAKVAAQIAEFNIPYYCVTVSVDGPPYEHEQLRGIPGGFSKALETYKLLRQIKGLRPFIGMTLYPTNHDKIEATLTAIRKEVPDFSMQNFHINLMHISRHYYGNSHTATKLSAETMTSLNEYRALRGFAWTPMDWIESRYSRLAIRYISEKQTPVTCAALSASCFISEKGLVHPCTIWDRPMGNLREFNYELNAIIQSSYARELRQTIVEKNCANCWTPCEAFQSIISNDTRWLMKMSRAPIDA